ncbi:MAG: caspase family protein [Planctomycetes bacterium]|nr:caspase family protein [Planctomycetota bacterium]MCB9828398.1 caspase family protein [Planctomycetota bacterium]
MHRLTHRFNEGRSLHVGLNAVSPEVYQGHLQPLLAAENDAREMSRLALARGLAARLLLGSEATIDQFAGAVQASIERMIPGDNLVITFAGHGVSLRQSGDDADGHDEAWCLVDGIVLDDDLGQMLAEVPEGCEVVVVSDTCFAAGIVDEQQDVLGAGARPSLAPSAATRLRIDQIARLPIRPELPGRVPGADGADVGVLGIDAQDLRDLPTDILGSAGVLDGGSVLPRGPRTRAADDALAQLYREGRLPHITSKRSRSVGRTALRADLVALSASEEGQLAFEGPEHGLFTAALLAVFELVEVDRMSYEALMSLVRAALVVQTPSLGTIQRRPEGLHRQPALRLGVLPSSSA